MSSGSFTSKLFTEKFYMYKQDLALNNHQGFICHKPSDLNFFIYNK